MFYKPLSFVNEHEITKKLQDFYRDLNNHDVHTNTAFSQDRPHNEIAVAVPELVDQLISMKFSVKRYVLFRTSPYRYWSIHRDLDAGSTGLNLVLNWPVFNCENTFTNFYSVDGKPMLMTWTVYSSIEKEKFEPIEMYDDNAEYKLIDQLELISPHLVDINTPHAVVNEQPYSRMMLSIRFNHNPLHLWN